MEVPLPATQPHDQRVLAARAREQVLGRLRLVLERDGALAAAVVMTAADELGCSPRSVRRWLTSGPPGGRVAAPCVIDDELYAAYVRWHANAAAVWRELAAAGSPAISLRSLQRAFVRELRPAERAAARLGEPGLRAHGLYVQWEAGHRNEVWQGDHKQLDVLLIAAPGRRPARPWSTIFLDACSRAIMGWAISLRPSSAEVLAALREAMLPDPLGGPLAGIPERLRIDHGLEFCAHAVRDAALALDIDFSLATAYAPHEKGKIERLHLTLVNTLLRGLPCYTGGRRAANGRLQDAGEPLTLVDFVGRFAAWVREYNEREHSALGRRTPLGVFTADPTPMRTISAADARALLAARKTVQIRRFGVRHQNRWFTSPELCELVGEEAQIAFAPHDQRSVEVYWRDEWICTAAGQDTLSEADQRELIEARSEHARELRNRQRTAARRARTRLAPLTDTDRVPVELPAAPPDERDRPAGSERALRAAARTDLLLEHTGPPRARNGKSDGQTLP